jgi:three-Cys-motif partner protein
VTKTREKYEWTIGSPPPLIDMHSVVKHDLVQQYLDRYIRVLLTNPNIENLTLSVVDGFAGGGEYTAQNGTGIHDGSPLIALRTIVETEALLNVGRTKPRRVNAEYVFVEKEPSNYEYLHALITTRCGARRLDQDIRVLRSAFQDALKSIIERIKERRGGERAIFLLDQYAYDQVPLPLLREIFESLRGAEVILTFNVDSLITFLSDAASCRRKLKEMGMDQYMDWDSLRTLKDSDPLWKAQIQRQLAQGIIEGSGAAFSTIFFITPAATPAWTYWLIHLSNAYKARDVMMELHWGFANHFSHFLEPDIFTLGHTAGRGAKRRDQQDFDLGEAFNFDAVAAKRCEDGLREKLIPRIYGLEQVRFGNLLAALGNSTPATAGMIKNALDFSIQTREIEALGETGARREVGRTLRLSDTLRRPAQHSIAFGKKSLR